MGMEFAKHCCQYMRPPVQQFTGHEGCLCITASQSWQYILY